jgi:uncharacterized protein
MLVPSLACQASCAYCFGPNQGPTMPLSVFDATVDWLGRISPPGTSVEVTFHGGEPLLAGAAWYERNLAVLRARFGPDLKVGIQSNLWLLDDEYCALFGQYGVSIGTSLDGPAAINDAQRGEGYFARTMAGIDAARRHGLPVGLICTFTARSAPHYREVFEFFADQQLAFSIHGAVWGLGNPPRSELHLPPADAGQLFVALFDHYVDHMTRVRIPFFDAVLRGLSARGGALCTFDDCLGRHLAVTPSGEIYPCSRFVHHAEWTLGSVLDQPDLETLARSPAWQRLDQRRRVVLEDCAGCPHFPHCQGGCAYQAAARGAGRRDPYCPAYRRLFDRVADRALDEVFSPRNLAVVVRDGPGRQGLLRKGKLLSIMRGGPHPEQVARSARTWLAAVALATSTSLEEAIDRLDRAGLVARREAALNSLRTLQERLTAPSQQELLNAYVHVTDACDLACTHCYARSGPDRSAAMALDDVARLARQAVEAGFRKLIITGGEPLVHPRRDTLLDLLAGLRAKTGVLETVLRTNLAGQLPPALLQRIAHSTDRVVVSIDGDETLHDARRGAGAYARTLSNLHKLLAADPSTRVSLSAALIAEEAQSQAGDAVRALGRELGLPVRVKAVLPLGRAAEMGLASLCYSPTADPEEAVAWSGQPASTCGLGMNLYVAPDGECFPCYALAGVAGCALGNALPDGLATVLARNDRYRRFTVDTNRRCRDCALRYLCGGLCRAWSRGADPDAPPGDCAGLQRRAWELVRHSLEALEVSVDRWTAAGLPLGDGQSVAPQTVMRSSMAEKGGS